MKVYFTLESSLETVEVLGIINDIQNEVTIFFQNRQYSEDLEILYIALFCMSPQFASFFKHRKPKYSLLGGVYVQKEVEFSKEPKTFEYELRLDSEKYSSPSINVRSELAKDIIGSLDAVSKCKQIKDLNLILIQNDFLNFFCSIGWLS